MYAIFDSDSIDIAAIFLNGPKTISDANLKLWKKAKWRTVVDGFANVVHSENRLLLKPNLITGDFDSITEETLNFYKSEACTEIVPTPDQSYIDMEKSVTVTVDRLNHYGIASDCLVVSGIAGGRSDHAVANLHALRRAQLRFQMPVFLLTEMNISRVLLPGRHVIDVKSSHRGETCGVIPLYEPATVTTHGLQWNVDNAVMSMIGLISTSNKFATEDEVTIETDKPILFTCEIA